jgi:hypothetical protein
LRSGLLVVARRDYQAEGLGRRRVRHAAFSDAEVLELYAGVDGHLWPHDPEAAGIHLERGLASLTDIDRVAQYAASLNVRTRCDVLRIDREPINSPTDEAGWEFLGFDFGVVEGEFNVYSFLYHEVIYSRFNELGAFARRLNRHLLIDRLEVIRELRAALDDLESSGERFETTDAPEICDPLAVFSQAKSP